MESFFRERDQKLTICIVGDGDTEVAFIKGFKLTIDRHNLLPSHLDIKVRSLRTGGGNPSSALDQALRKHFNKGQYHRCILVVDSEGKKVSSDTVKRAERVGVELVLSEPCIERHLLNIHEIDHKMGLRAAEYKQLLRDHFGGDFHPLKYEWHAEKIGLIPLSSVVRRDPHMTLLHSVFTGADHPNYHSR